MRFRYLFIGLGSALVLGALFATDPDRGITTGMLLLSLVTPILALAFGHLARKALFDYPEADARALFSRAAQEPTGAGLALVALAIVTAALLGLFGRSAQAATVDGIPAAAHSLLPMVAAETRTHWPELPAPAYVPALIEHESCLSLTHRRCWSPTAELRSAREQGLGLGQLTRAWRADGTLRFDALADQRQRHPELRELSWATLRDRPDLQVRTLVLMSRDTWQALRVVAEPMARLAFTDAAYNGGLAGVTAERRACHLAPGCDPQQWFGHVEAHCLKSRAALYGGRSACDINRHHVADVLRQRMPRYMRVMA